MLDPQQPPSAPDVSLPMSTHLALHHAHFGQPPPARLLVVCPRVNLKGSKRVTLMHPPSPSTPHGGVPTSTSSLSLISLWSPGGGGNRTSWNGICRSGCQLQQQNNNSPSPTGGDKLPLHSATFKVLLKNWNHPLYPRCNTILHAQFYKGFI